MWFINASVLIYKHECLLLINSAPLLPWAWSR